MNKEMTGRYIDPKRLKMVDSTCPFIFCFHYAGGTAGAFKGWEANKKVNFIPIELPGHGRRIREELTSSMSKNCQAIALEIADLVESEGGFCSDFSLYGHSMGAIIAFCVGKILLEKYQIRPTCMQVSGRHAPMDEDPSAFRTEQGVDALVEELRFIGHTPAEFLEVKEFRDFFIPLIFNDYLLAENYSYDGTVVDIPLFAYCGRGDTDADESVMDGWKQVTSDRFQVKSFDGDHFFIFEDSNFFSDQLAGDLLELCSKTADHSAIKQDRLPIFDSYYEKGEV